MDKKQTMQIVQRTLAADCNCNPKDLMVEQTRVVVHQEVCGRRRFKVREKHLFLVSMGKATVISCDKSRLDWAQESLSGLARDELFSASFIAFIEEYIRQDKQMLAGPDLKYVCSTDSFCVVKPPMLKDIIYTSYDEDIISLYDYEGFGNALSYEEDSERPDVLAVVAWLKGQIIAIAAATADSQELWQVGIEVKRTYHNLGIGSYLVNKLTTLVLQAGKVPYYSTNVANISSRSLALKSGYWPAWVELYSI